MPTQICASPANAALSTSDSEKLSHVSISEGENEEGSGTGRCLVVPDVESSKPRENPGPP